MPEALKGKVVVFGVDGTVAMTGTGILGTTEIQLQSASLKESVEQVDLQTSHGDVVSTAYANRQHAVDLEFIPFDPGSPGNLATHSAKIFLPDPGSVVTLASFAPPQFNGTWNYAGGGSITPTARGFLRMSLPLTRKGTSAGQPVSL